MTDENNNRSFDEEIPQQPIPQQPQTEVPQQPVSQTPQPEVPPQQPIPQTPQPEVPQQPIPQTPQPEVPQQPISGSGSWQQYSANQYFSPTPSAPPPKKPKRNKTAVLIITLVAVYFLLIGLLFVGINGGVIKFDFGNNGTVAPVTEEETEPSSNAPISSSKNEEGKPAIVNDDFTGETLSTSQIYQQNVESIVYVETTTRNSKSMGTGFIIDEVNGYILTNYHVVENGVNIAITLKNGDSYDAELLGGDSVNDIAVLKVNVAGLRKVTIGDSETLEVGEDIIVIGNPLGDLTYTLTKGVISALNRSINTGEYTITMFQIDAAANSGNSGGPAFDNKGAVVGIVSAKYAATGVEGIGFCIPINDAIRIATDLVNYGYVAGRPNFGITVSTSSGYTASTDEFGRRVVTETTPGAYIEAVNSGSCAEKAGLKVGDIVTKLGDKKILSSTELINAKNAYKAGETTTLEVFRDGSIITLTITFDEYIPTNE